MKKGISWYCRGMLPVLWLAAASPGGAGEIKRWIGPDGSVHFGDQPPTGAQFDSLGTTTPDGTTESDPPGLRPGERAMIEKFDTRNGRRSRSADNTRENRGNHKTGSDAELAARRCEYYETRLASYQRKRRRGYTRQEESKLEDNLAWARMKVAEYCR